eukprot:Rhum_TRINITY_DN15280_c0_g1::Rhum_TRINITY_DN15280_c0_g1_i1::g.147380::m.147380
MLSSQHSPLIILLLQPQVADLHSETGLPALHGKRRRLRARRGSRHAAAGVLHRRSDGHLNGLHRSVRHRHGRLADRLAASGRHRVRNLLRQRDVELRRDLPRGGEHVVRVLHHAVRGVLDVLRHRQTQAHDEGTLDLTDVHDRVDRPSQVVHDVRTRVVDLARQHVERRLQGHHSVRVVHLPRRVLRTDNAAVIRQEVQGDAQLVRLLDDLRPRAGGQKLAHGREGLVDLRAAVLGRQARQLRAHAAAGHVGALRADDRRALLQDADRVHGQPQVVRDGLRHLRRQALAHLRAARHHAHGSVAVHPHVRVHERRVLRLGSTVADGELRRNQRQTLLRPPVRGVELLHRRQTRVVVGRRLRLRPQLVDVPVLQLQARRRDLVLLVEVNLTHGGRLESEVDGHRRDHTLHAEDGGQPARGTHRRVRRQVRLDHGTGHVPRGDVVAVVEGAHVGAQVAAAVGGHAGADVRLELHDVDATSLVETDSGVAAPPGAGAQRQHVVALLVHDRHGHTGLVRADRRELRRRKRVHQLAAEAAAAALVLQNNVALLQLQHGGDGALHEGRHLRRRVHAHAALGLGESVGRLRLHVEVVLRAHLPRVLHHALRLRQLAGNVAHREVVRLLVRVEALRRCGDGVVNRQDQLLLHVRVRHRHSRCGRDGLGRRRRQGNGDDVADVHGGAVGDEGRGVVRHILRKHKTLVADDLVRHTSVADRELANLLRDNGRRVQGVRRQRDVLDVLRLAGRLLQAVDLRDRLVQRPHRLLLVEGLLALRHALLEPRLAAGLQRRGQRRLQRQEELVQVRQAQRLAERHRLRPARRRHELHQRRAQRLELRLVRHAHPDHALLHHRHPRRQRPDPVEHHHRGLDHPARHVRRQHARHERLRVDVPLRRPVRQQHVARLRVRHREVLQVAVRQVLRVQLPDRQRPLLPAVVHERHQRPHRLQQQRPLRRERRRLLVLVRDHHVAAERPHVPDVPARRQLAVLQELLERDRLRRRTRLHRGLQHRQRVRDRRPGPQHQPRAADRARREARHPAHVHVRRRRLVRPQPLARVPAHQEVVRLPADRELAQRRLQLRLARHLLPRRARPHLARHAPLRRRQRGRHRPDVRARLARERLVRVQDRAVPRAPAVVRVDHRVQRLLRQRRLAVRQLRVQVHHHPHGAEPALRPREVRQRLLHRVGLRRAADPGPRRDRHPVAAQDRPQARVERPAHRPPQRRVRVREHAHARPAPAHAARPPRPRVRHVRRDPVVHRQVHRHRRPAQVDRVRLVVHRERAHARRLHRHRRRLSLRRRGGRPAAPALRRQRRRDGRRRSRSRLRRRRRLLRSRLRHNQACVARLHEAGGSVRRRHLQVLALPRHHRHDRAVGQHARVLRRRRGAERHRRVPVGLLQKDALHLCVLCVEDLPMKYRYCSF